MKKHQFAAMLLSAISAGILMSCTKSNDDNPDSDSSNSSTTSQDAVQAEPAHNQADKDRNTNTAALSADKSVTTTADAANLTDDQNTPMAIDLSADTRKRYLTHVIQSDILPAYKDVVNQSQKLNALATEYCKADELDKAKLQLLRSQWLSLAIAWANAEVINFGPATDSMSNLYINYYPDERGLVHQGVIDLINANPKLTAEQLGSQSAIVQGIPGMEEVLYANETLSQGQCHYIISASSALTKRLADINTAWMASPEDVLGMTDNGGFSDSSESSGSNGLAMNRWINSLLSLVETTKSNALAKPLGLTGSKKGHLPAAAAGQSKAIITAKVAALNKALTDPVLVAMLTQNNKDTLTDDMSTTLTEASALLAQLPDDIADATQAQQQQLYDKLTQLTRIVKHQLMPTLGVQVGFNSTDGD